MMEKQGEIRDDITPPESLEKRGEHLEDHLTKRAADEAEKGCGGGRPAKAADLKV